MTLSNITTLLLTITGTLVAAHAIPQPYGDIVAGLWSAASAVWHLYTPVPKK